MKRIPRFPLRAAVQLLPAFYLIVLALLVLPGCSGGAVKRSSGDSAVLPYSVGVFLQESAGAGMDPLAAQAVLDATCNALQGDGAVVSRALSLSSRTIPAALREGRNMDFLVGVRLETETALPEPVVSSGAATLEVLTWLFGGIPSWFVPTLEYPLSGGMEMVVFDLNDSNTRSWLKQAESASSPPPAHKLVFAGGSRSLSLVDRSDGAGAIDNYLMSIIMPPLFVAGDPEMVRGVLNKEATAGFIEKLREELRSRLLGEERGRPLRVVFPRASSRAGFAFDLFSSEPAGVRVLDLHRIAEGAETFRWVLRGAELQRVNGLLEKDGQARIEVPGGVPLVAGRNLVKVRALRKDGIRVSRTVILISDGQK